MDRASSDAVWLTMGGSGGSRIFGAVAQTLLNLDWGHDLASAVELPRVHHQLLPEYVSRPSFPLFLHVSSSPSLIVGREPEEEALPDLLVALAGLGRVDLPHRHPRQPAQPRAQRHVRLISAPLLVEVEQEDRRRVELSEG